MHSVDNLATLQTPLATFFPSKKRPNLVSENHRYCRASARSCSPSTHTPSLSASALFSAHTHPLSLSLRLLCSARTHTPLSLSLSLHLLCSARTHTPLSLSLSASALFSAHTHLSLSLSLSLRLLCSARAHTSLSLCVCSARGRERSSALIQLNTDIMLLLQFYMQV